MRLEDLAPAHVRRAVEIYADIAWPPDQPGRPPFGGVQLEGAVSLEELLERFDRPPASENRQLRRWTLRLGNHRYPFMKFVLQEYLVGGEFFFSVDTHDNLQVRPNSPDYEEWKQLRRHNRALKKRIEAAWLEAGLPTHDDLRMLAEELAHVEREEQKGARLLVVEDEHDVAQGLLALLRARGYQVELAVDGEQAMDRLGREPLPDLLLLDLELPELDGQEVLDRMRADPRLADLPVLMATAASIELSRLRRVSGLLRKPYPRQVLFTMISQLLGARRESGQG